METFIAIGSAHALYFSILIISKRKKDITDFTLAIFLFLFFLVFGVIYISFEWKLPDLQIFIWNISLLLAPVFYFYSVSLMSNQKKFKASWFLHFTPYILSIFILLDVLDHNSDAEIEKLLNTTILFKEFNILYFFSFLDFIVIPVYLLLVLRLLRYHRNKVSNTFSNYKGRDLHWLKILIIGIFGIWIVINYFLYFSSFTDEKSLMYGFGFATFFIFYIGYFGTKQTAIFTNVFLEKRLINQPEITKNDDLIKESITTKKYNKSSLKDSDIELYHQKLTVYMEKEKPYLNNDLNLYDLASSVEISTHNLSQLLNKKFNKSFYEYINSYRVDEFKKRVQKGDYKKFTILAIALESGFNSKSSFNRIFKKATKNTPLEFIKNNT